MPFSGNLGDTLNVMPVLSGLYKKTGDKIHLVFRNKMKMFNGIRDLLLLQECIEEVIFESDCVIDSSFYIMSLTDNFEMHWSRPYETVRLEEFFKNRYRINFDVDDDFILNVPDNLSRIDNCYLIGDRVFDSKADQRREFGIIKNSGKFNSDQFKFIDYNLSIVENSSIIKNTNRTIYSTFTGISVLIDLLNKEQIVLYGDDLINWDNKPIQYSFNKHFYRNRKSKLMYINDLKFEDENEFNRI